MGGNQSKKDKKENEGHSTGTIVAVGLIAAAAGAAITYFANKEAKVEHQSVTNQSLENFREQTRNKEQDCKIESFFCRITNEIMKDPVQTPAGHSYERSAIVQWIKQHGTDPLTFQTLKEEDIRPNIDLRNSIQDYLATLN